MPCRRINFAEIDGLIPERFKEMKALTLLSITRSKLAGFLPITLRLPPNLRTLVLARNKLRGERPVVGRVEAVGLACILVAGHMSYEL